MTTFETNLKNLKSLHAKYAAKVKKLAAQRDALAAKLADATDKELQLADSIAVLENRPTLTKMLTDVIQKPAAPALVGEYAEHAQPSNPDGTVQPPAPAERGFQWVRNELNEWVLIPLKAGIPLNGNAETAASILLPAVDESSNFTDGELDMMQ